LKEEQRRGGVLKKIFEPEKEPVRGGRRNSIMKRFFALLQKY
jgi:hypothetical protein